MVRLKHEYERGCAVLVEHIYMSFSSLCIFWKKLSLILCLNELILFKSNLRRELYICFAIYAKSIILLEPSKSIVTALTTCKIKLKADFVNCKRDQI